MRKRRFEQDEAVRLEIDGVAQRIRLCAARTGLPPLLVVQGGPGLPLLNEVSRFQTSLSLEEDFTVAYWDQRGCGNAARDAHAALSLERLLDDLCFVIRWLNERTGMNVALLGISMGGTLAMRAAAREESLVSAVIAISPDLNVALADANAHSILIAASSESARMSRALARLGPPPYLSPSRFQERLTLVADLGGIERGKKFGDILAELAWSLVKRYGLFGAAAALQNARSMQAMLLPQLAELDLFSSWPESASPFHLVFGEDDFLSPHSLVEAASRHCKDEDSLIVLPRAGHMVHFDRPDAVREIVRSRALLKRPTSR